MPAFAPTAEDRHALGLRRRHRHDDRRLRRARRDARARRGRRASSMPASCSATDRRTIRSCSAAARRPQGLALLTRRFGIARLRDVGAHRVRVRRPGARHGDERDPPRLRRPRARRRLRFDDQPDRPRRLLPALGAVSPDNDTPERASRPFDATRNGFLLGEGAGFVVLEEWEARARARRAHLRRARRRRQLAVVLPHHRLASRRRRADPGDAPGARRRRRDAGDVDYLNAHGTSTPMNDKSESGGDPRRVRRPASARWPSARPRA